MARCWTDETAFWERGLPVDDPTVYCFTQVIREGSQNLGNQTNYPKGSMKDFIYIYNYNYRTNNKIRNRGNNYQSTNPS